MTKRSADGRSGYGDDPTANHPASAFFPVSRQVEACRGVRMKNGLSGRGEAVA